MTGTKVAGRTVQWSARPSAAQEREAGAFAARITPGGDPPMTSKLKSGENFWRVVVDVDDSPGGRAVPRLAAEEATPRGVVRHVIWAWSLPVALPLVARCPERFAMWSSKRQTRTSPAWPRISSIAFPATRLCSLSVSRPPRKAVPSLRRAALPMKSSALVDKGTLPVCCSAR